jgi:putative restriction endonuclease
MKLYVGITDRDWFRFLRLRKAEEMNFWRPRNTSDFGAIQPGEFFLFKTRFPENRIVGGAFFLRHTTLPLDLAWSTFGEANGVASLAEFRNKISSLRGDLERNPVIGCTVLTQPFYLDGHSFLAPPSDWASNIVTGKSYNATIGEGLRLYEQARAAILLANSTSIATNSMIAEEAPRYGEERLMRPRLGQGGFRVLVMDEYERRCAITGERTLPVLEAAHIQPYAEEGPHDVSNGLLLRSDLHTLFDKGYVTVTNDLRVEVSRRIREEFSNGHDYYALHGRELKVLPADRAHRPAINFLEWHQNNSFLGA